MRSKPCKLLSLRRCCVGLIVYFTGFCICHWLYLSDQSMSSVTYHLGRITRRVNLYSTLNVSNYTKVIYLNFLNMNKTRAIDFQRVSIKKQANESTTEWKSSIATSTTLKGTFSTAKPGKGTRHTNFSTTASATVYANTSTIGLGHYLIATASASTMSPDRSTGESVMRDLSTGQKEKQSTTISRSDDVISAGNESTARTVYLFMNSNGRLGNLMFQFAALVGTARLHNMTAAIPEDSRLRKIFNVNINELNSSIASTFLHVGDKRHCAFDPIRADFRSNLTLSGFFQSWRYFSHVSSEIREQFTFREDIVKRARSALQASLHSQHPHFCLNDTTFVGVHIRRGDILQPDKIKFGYAAGSKDYLFRAMSNFIDRYKSVMFIVCSNDMAWAKEAIPDENATFITGQEAEVDMAILSLCNHTIMTVGSYGWWSAWLAGGTTIYQIQQTIPGTDLDKRFYLTDYMLPEWIGLNQTSSETSRQTHLINVSTIEPNITNAFDASTENFTSSFESELVVN